MVVGDRTWVNDRFRLLVERLLRPWRRPRRSKWSNQSTTWFRLAASTALSSANERAKPTPNAHESNGSSTWKVARNCKSVTAS